MTTGEVESYLDGFPIGCQHLLRQLHHLQGHVRNGLGVTLHLLVESSCHAVRVSYRLDLRERRRRRGSEERKRGDVANASLKSKPLKSSCIQASTLAKSLERNLLLHQHTDLLTVTVLLQTFLSMNV